MSMNRDKTIQGIELDECYASKNVYRIRENGIMVKHHLKPRVSLYEINGLH